MISTRYQPSHGRTWRIIWCVEIVEKFWRRREWQTSVDIVLPVTCYFKMFSTVENGPSKLFRELSPGKPQFGVSFAIFEYFSKAFRSGACLHFFRERGKQRHAIFLPASMIGAPTKKTGNSAFTANSCFGCAALGDLLTSVLTKNKDSRSDKRPSTYSFALSC